MGYNFNEYKVYNSIRFAFIPVSVIQAADVIVPHQSEQVIPSVITSPPFSWAGFYFGGQIGGFSSKISAMTRDVDIPLYPDESSKNKKWVPVEKQYMPKLSGFIGGFLYRCQSRI